MSDPYKKFATETYNTVYDAMKDGIAQSSNLPLLFMSGEEHHDSTSETMFNATVRSSKEEPAMAGAYTHIASIKSAEALVGKDCVVVSFEIEQETLDMIKSYYQTNQLDDTLNDLRRDLFFNQDAFEEYPFYTAIKYALDNGYNVTASDALRPKVLSGEIKEEATERLDAEKDALGKIALRTDNRPDIVVHIGGAAHIGYLQGYTDQELVKTGDNLTRDEDRNPFHGIYGQSVFMNSSHPNPLQKVFALGKMSAYLENPENAIQLDPPGKMDEADITEIVERIEAAATERATLEDTKAGQGDMNMNDTIPTANPINGMGQK